MISSKWEEEEDWTQIIHNDCGLPIELCECPDEWDPEPRAWVWWLLGSVACAASFLGGWAWRGW